MEMEKNVDFENLALVIQKPKLNTDKSILIQGNFSELSEKIRSVVDRYKDEVLTDDNVGYIKTLKSQFVSLRTGIERERKEYKKAYLDPATKLVNSMCDELQKIVQEGEDALSSQLDAYDQKRKDELTIVLKEYIEEASLRHSLREEYKEKIKILDKYYNKTQKEEDSCDDIERQATELERQQKEYDVGLSLIKAECLASSIQAEPYIRAMEYKSVAEIITEIKEDRKAKEEATTEEKITVGKPIREELEKAMSYSQSEKRTRIVRITYTSDKAKLISRFFTDNKIDFEFLKTDF